MKLRHRILLQTVMSVAFAAMFLGLLQANPGVPLAQAATYMYALVVPGVASDGTGTSSVEDGSPNRSKHAFGMKWGSGR